MRRLPLPLVLLLVFSIYPSFAATIVRTIRVDGNHALSTRIILGVIGLRPNGPFSRSQLGRDSQALLQLYHRSGFYFAEVTADSVAFSSDSSTVDVLFSIAEHERLEVGMIHLEGNTALSRDEILQQFDTRSGGILDEQLLEHDINGLLSRYEEIGYPFASIRIDGIRLSGDEGAKRLQVDIAIDEGRNVQVNEIKIIGNTETRDGVIVREARIKPGETFNQTKLAKIRQRLNRLNIFASVQEPELYMDSAGGGILIKVQEGSTNTFDGVVGYAPGNSANNGGTITGLVNVSMRNLFGTARKLHVEWLKDDSHSQEISFNYVEPWVFELPVNLTMGFLQRQQDTTYVRRDLEAKADVLVSETFSLGWIFHHQSIIPSDLIVSQTVSDSRTVTTGLELRYDSRNDLLSPTSGVEYQSDYQIGNKSIVRSQQLKSNERHAVQKLSLDADFYVEAISHQVIAVGIHGRQITSDIIELGDLYRFGGTATLRGYRENEFLGSRIAWTNAEYRFLLSRHSFFFGFFDSGYYFLPGDDLNGISSIQHLKYGYGVGIRLETSLGNLGVSIALGEGDTFSQAKLHIGLINDF
jgi:outer membrane protein assembly factor BamA